MKTLFALAFAAAASAVSAEGIGLNMPEIGKGSYALYKVNKDTYSHVFVGTSGDYYVYDVVPGNDPNAMEGRSRYFRDALGQTVRWVTADGGVVSFTPHNCQRTLGRCEFIEEGVIDGKPYKTRMVRTNRKTAKGYSFEQIGYDDEGTSHRLMSGSVELDDYGLVRRAKMRNAEAKTRFKRLKAVIR